MRHWLNMEQLDDVHPDPLEYTLYFLSICLAVVSAAFWCFFNFLTSEDAIVLFNRYNYLEGAPTFFYYAGYTSIFPQSVAFLSSAVNPAIQAIFYSVAALIVFLLLLREVFLATQSGLISIILVSVCAVFSPFVIYNLTYSFWTGLAVLGLVGLRCHAQRDALSLRDILICLPGLAGSPLAIVFFPLFAWASLTSRSTYVYTICVGTVVSFVALVEHGGARGDGQGLLSSLVANGALALGQPLQYLISFESPGSLAMSVLGSLSLPIVVATGLWAVWCLKVAGVPVALYILGSVATLVAALGASSVPLAGRYWFPVVVCALTLIGRFWTIPIADPARKSGGAILAVVLCAAILTSFFLRYERWGGAAASIEEWRTLANPPPNMTSIVRDWHGDGGQWAIGAGQGALRYEDCAGLWEHPLSFERFGFRIYCWRGVFE